MVVQVFHHQIILNLNPTFIFKSFPQTSTKIFNLSKDKLKADIDILPLKNINKDEEFRLLPPLIKAYIRAGAWIGKGAVVDKNLIQQMY